MEQTVCGTKIHYELTGKSGTGRVVLLHGWGCDISLMRSVAGALESDLQVLSVDFPGHGASGRPPEPWGVPEYAEALLELLRSLDFLPCSVVAHSFGGRVAIWLASQDRSLFTRMVLTGAAGIRKPQTEEARKRSAQYQRLKKLCLQAGKVPFLKEIARDAEETLRKRYGSADYNALDEEMRKTFVKVISLDLSDRLPMVAQPTLLLWGDKDTETPLWMGQKMEKEIPDAALIVLEGGTHFAYLEQAARFNTIVKHFLTEG